MDELEISGKRYLSTRRAAKDHKYTSDYVGQLIRGGKVIGKKVGRSWYVEEASLNAYLRGEPAAAPTPKSVVKEPVVEKMVEPEKPAVVVAEVEKERAVVEAPVKKVDEGEKVFEPVIIKSVPIEEHHIPVNTLVKEKPMGGLRYIVDDEPSLPEIKKMPRVAATRVMPAPVVEEAPVQEQYVEEEVEIIPRKKVGAFALASVVVVGLVTLGLTALLSTTLNSRIVVEEGQVASVGYTFQ